MDFGNILAHFKKMESPLALVPLMNEKELDIRDGLVAWNSVRIKYVKVDILPESESENDKWEWLWKHVQYSPAQFSAISGVSNAEAESLFTRLKGLKLIYPDGTISGLASNFLKSIIMEKLQKAQKRQKKD